MLFIIVLYEDSSIRLAEFIRVMLHELDETILLFTKKYAILVFLELG
jgi:hypothetical protein